MAVTILQSPALMAAAYNPLLYLVQSNNTAQPNFRFIAEIKDSGGTVLAKRKFPIIPDTTRGWFDPHKVLETLISHDFDRTQVASAEAESSWVEYLVVFGEEYGTTPTEYLSLATSTRRCWNAAIQATDEWPGFDIADWELVDSLTTGKWLSAFGNSKTIALDQADYLALITTNTGPTRIKVVATLSSGGPTTSVFTLGTLGSGYRMYLFPSGPTNLNEITTLISGTPGAVIPATCTSYTIQATNAGGVVSSPTRTYTIEGSEFCTGYTDCDVFFLNRYGLVESFRFDARHDITRELSRETIEAPIIQYADGVIGYAESAGSLRQFSTNIRKRLQLKSRWITDDESTSLIDLFSSPLVWVEIAGELRSVSVELTAHRQKRRENEPLESFELTAQYSIGDRRQSR